MKVPYSLPQTAIKLNDMRLRYMVKLLIRLGLFSGVLALYIADKPFLYSFMTHRFTFGVAERGFSFLHVLWAVFMVMMLTHLLPKEKMSMALLKARKEKFVPADSFDETELLKFVQRQNVRAWAVMLVWLVLNAGIGILYLFGFLDNADLLMISVFYFLCDYICILFFCPFQTFIMKNKCCVNCRIFDWGHFMMFTPMLFIKNFFSWSLFFTAVIVLIHWEIIYAQHPERFWEQSNQRLQCANCRDKTCWVKHGILHTLHRESHPDP